MGALSRETLIFVATITVGVTHGHAPILAVIERHAYTFVRATSGQAVLNRAVPTWLTQVTCYLCAAVKIGGTGISNLRSTSGLEAGDSKNK